jgi:hypothetical protein
VKDYTARTEQSGTGHLHLLKSNQRFSSRKLDSEFDQELPLTFNREAKADGPPHEGPIPHLLHPAGSDRQGFPHESNPLPEPLKCPDEPFARWRVERQRHRHFADLEKVKAMELPVDPEWFPREGPIRRAGSAHRIWEGLRKRTIAQKEKLREGRNSHRTGGEIDPVPRTSKRTFLRDHELQAEEGGDGFRCHCEDPSPRRTVGAQHSEIAEGAVFGRKDRKAGVDPCRGIDSVRREIVGGDHHNRVTPRKDGHLMGQGSEPHCIRLSHRDAVPG